MVRHARRGFTLVELLVVIAIISLLIAMLLPAIQAARESGRRAACSSNLKQFATAVHVFHERHNSMPTYQGWFPGEGSYGKGAYGSWYVHLMPVMEQQIAYQKLWDSQAASYNAEGEWRIKYTFGRAKIATNPGEPGQVCKQKIYYDPECPSGSSYSCKSVSGGGNTPHNGHNYEYTTQDCGCWGSDGQKQGSGSTPSPAYYEIDVSCDTPVWQNAGLAIAEVNFPSGVLFCGSDPSPPEQTYRWSYNTDYALSNYQANFNVFARGKKYDSNKPQGFGAISDGLSQTILFAEGHRQCDRASDRGVRMAVYADLWHHNFGVNWHKEANTLMFQDRPTPQRCDNWRVQANHGGALLVALGDGSVRGISSKISRRELSDPDNPPLGGSPDYGLGNPPGNWDRLMLPDDGGGANFE